MDSQKALHQFDAALHSQYLTSFTGGSDMLEYTPKNTSYEDFVAATDGIYRSEGPSRSRTSSQAIRPNFSSLYEHPPHLLNGLRSQQPALTSSFQSSADSSPDWAREQSAAANDEVSVFSPFDQGYNLGHSHQPQHALQAPILACYSASQAQEHMSQDLELESQYSDNYSPLHRGASFQELLTTSRSPQLHPPDSPSSVLDARPYPSSTLPRAIGYYQASPRGHPGHGSQDGTPTVVISCPGDMDTTPPLIPMLNSSDLVQDASFTVPYDFPYNIMAQPEQGGIKATGSATFALSPSAEATRGYYTSSETASTIATCPPATGRSRGKVKSKSKKKSKNKDIQAAGTSRRRRRRSESHSVHFGSPGSPSLGQSPSHIPSGRRSSSGLALLSRSRLYTSKATDGNAEGARKSRGKRVGPLPNGNRELATKRRNDRTVCIGCKMAKVMCAGREDGGDCVRCASSHSSAPKPFVCAPASFFELVQQGSTVLLALHAIYPLNPSTGLREPISLPAEIHLRDLLHSIDDLQRTYDTVRVYAGPTRLCELDLRACWTYISSIGPPLPHPFQQFIDGLKLHKYDGWKACIRDGKGQPLNDNLCDALLALDDMAPWVKYALVRKDSGILYGNPNGGAEMFLDPGDRYHRQVIIVAAQLSRIIGRKLELQFYDHLKKVLGNPSICHKLVLDVGRTLLSLRRRLAHWKQTWAAAPHSGTQEREPHAQGYDGTGSNVLSDPVSRIKSLCQVLYVYFCYMRRRLSPDEQEGMRTTRVWYPDRVQAVEESFPQYESIDGFEDWLRFGERPVAGAEMVLDQGKSRSCL